MLSKVCTVRIDESVKVQRQTLHELVASKITKVLLLCFIFRRGQDGLNLVSVAVLPDVLFDHEISDVKC